MAGTSPADTGRITGSTAEPAEVPYVRPGFFLSRIVNPIARRLGLTTTLTVPGRHTGRLHTTPMGRPFEFGGERYLVSGRGQTQWARNLRAAGKGQLRIARRTVSFTAVELFGPEHDAILSAYRQQVGHAVDAYFEQIPDPADHPVFRIETAARD